MIDFIKFGEDLNWRMIDFIKFGEDLNWRTGNYYKFGGDLFSPMTQKNNLFVSKCTCNNHACIYKI